VARTIATAARTSCLGDLSAEAIFQMLESIEQFTDRLQRRYRAQLNQADL